MSFSVTQLAIYPVKSLRAIAQQSMQIDRLGPKGDRRYIITDSSGRFLTQREYPSMCLIDVAIQGAVLTLSTPSMSPLRIDAAIDAKPTVVTVWRDAVEACDLGDSAAAWLTRYLGIEVRLHYMPDHSNRLIDQAYGKQGDCVSFADGFPILLITEASLREFNRALPQPIGSERFRPNIVIDSDVPYAEDQWRRLRIGSIEFDVVKPCSRCVIPSIDPLTGKKQPYVVQALARLRRRGNAVYFGQNLIHRGSGTISVGDPVIVLE